MPRLLDAYAGSVQRMWLDDSTTVPSLNREVDRLRVFRPDGSVLLLLDVTPSANTSVTVTSGNPRRLIIRTWAKSLVLPKRSLPLTLELTANASRTIRSIEVAGQPLSRDGNGCWSGTVSGVAEPDALDALFAYDDLSNNDSGITDGDAVDIALVPIEATAPGRPVFGLGYSRRVRLRRRPGSVGWYKYTFKDEALAGFEALDSRWGNRDENIKLTELPSGDPGVAGRVPTRLMLDGLWHESASIIWNDLVSRYDDQVRTDGGGHFTPAFTVGSSAHRWELLFEGRSDGSTPRRYVPRLLQPSVEFPDPKEPRETQLELIGLRAHDLASPKIPVRLEAPREVALPPELATCGTTAAAKSLQHLLQVGRALADRPVGARYPIAVRFDALAIATSKEASAASTVRIGAVDLTLPAHEAAPTSATTDVRTSELEIVFGMRPIGAGVQRSIQVVDSRVQLGLIEVGPGGQDPITTAAGPVDSGQPSADTQRRLLEDLLRRLGRREGAVVVPLSPSRRRIPLWAEFRERADARPDMEAGRTLVIEVFATKNAAAVPPAAPAAPVVAPIAPVTPPTADTPSACKAEENDGSPLLRVAVLDRQPFFVGKVSFPEFLIARSDGRPAARWTRLPYEAPHWALTEQREATVNEVCLTLPPQAVGEEMEKRANLAVREGSILDHRFGQPTRVALTLAGEPKSFDQAPWNIGRLLFDPRVSEDDPTILQLHVELLYGLACDLDRPGVNGAPYRLADVARRIGSIPPSMDTLRWDATATEEERKLFNAWRLRWGWTQRRLLGRLALVEPYTDAERYSLRALSVALNQGCYVRYPDAAGIVDPADVANPLGGTAAGQQAAELQGGALWGLESGNIFTAILEAPHSTSGEVTGLGLSALGGYGDLSVGLEKDRSRIAARVDMGRVARYVVERIGRIAVAGNKAKHVIVYERSLEASAQFAPPIQTPLHRRAVLRKVEEYVEILEPRREYAAGPGAANPGFVTACEFGKSSRIIRVDGAWGSDVGRRGWQIKLFDRAAHAMKPEVYPEPEIFFEVASVDETVSAGTTASRGALPALIRNPENVYFYTDVADPSPDPDQWPAISGVDFAPFAEPEPAPMPAPTPGARPEDATKAVPDETAVLPGFGRFTFEIDTVGRRVNLTPSSTTDQLTAPVETITFTRGPADLPPIPRAAADLLGSAGEVAKALGAARAAAALLEAKDSGIILAHLAGPVNGEKPEMAAIRAQYKAAVAALRSATDDAARTIAASANNVRTAYRDAQETAFAQWFTPPGDDRKAAPWRRMLEQFETEFSDDLRLLRDVGEIRSRLPQIVDRLRRRVACGEGASAALISPEPLHRFVESQVDAVRELVRAIDAQVATAITQVGNAPDPKAVAQEYLAAWRGMIDGALSNAAAAQSPWIAGGALLVEHALSEPLAAVDSLRRIIETEKPAPTVTTLVGAMRRVQSAVGRVDAELVKMAANLGMPLPPASAVASVCGHLGVMAAEIDSLQVTLGQALAQAGSDTQAARDALLKAFKSETDAWTTGIQARRAAIEAEASARLAQWFTVVGQAESTVRAPLVDLEARITTALAGAQASVDDVKKRLDQEFDRARGDAARLADRWVQDVLPVRDITTAADGAQRLIRAFAEPPRLPQLAFNRESLGYYYKEYRGGKLTFTPVTSKLREIDASLQAMGLSVPTREFGRRLGQEAAAMIPAELKDFDFNRIFDDFAGLKLGFLLKGLKMPADVERLIEIRHGFDAVSRRPWVKANVRDVRLPAAQLFSLGPLTLRVLGATFRASTTIGQGEGSTSRRSTEGSITASWQLEVGGTAVITLKDSELRFDSSGTLRFRVDPTKVMMAQALEFLTQLLQHAAPPGSGLSFGVIPGGVISRLDLPLPDIQTGTFAISNLNLGVHFGITFSPGFAIETGASLGRKNAPFALIIFVLGGGGWVDLGAKYVPATGKISARVSIGITAGASVGISLGPISGVVYVYVGVNVDYGADEGRSRGLRIGVILLIGGRVSLLGIVDISVSLLLEVSYGNGNMRGTGTLSVKVKICWCYTLKVRRRIDYRLGCTPQDSTHTHQLSGGSRVTDTDLSLLARDLIAMSY